MKNILKKGCYIIAVGLLSFVTACDDDDIEFKEISGLDFVIATLNLEGNEIGIVPTTVSANGNILYTVNFGAGVDDGSDVFPTSGPMVTYEYPNADGTYTITVTASLEGASDVSITKEVTITEYIPPMIPTGPGNSIVGSWKLAPEAGALGVGPELNNVSWWSSGAADVDTRACLFDDLYVFNEDFTFQNILGSETWLEPWQGTDPEACGVPLFPHDGNASATYVYDEAAGTLTINGAGAYMGLAKVNNDGELGSPADAPSSITYIIAIDGDTMELDIEFGGIGYWSFKLVRDVPTIVGTWKLAPEAGALGVGPSLDNVSWWSSGAADVDTRACLFDDEYVFNEDGTFQNILGSETWLEPWQGTDPEACGTPIFPHDGTASATYTYDEAAGTVTIDGKGAFLGLAKVNNDGELGSPGAAVDAITYIATLDGNTLELDIEFGGIGYWSFKLVKQ